MTPIADADLRARYQAAIVERRANPRTSCPTPDALQALITRTGDEMARLDVLDHVMGCADCHHEFELLRAIAAAETGAVSTSGASGRANRESARLLDRRGWMAAAAVLLVAVGGVTVLRRGGLGNRGPDVVRSRPIAVAGVPVVGVLPTGSGAAARALVWHRVSGAERYHVEVLDASGTVVFQAQTTDTLAALPALSGRGPRTWWVRATMADGTERQSGVVGLSDR